MAGALPPMATAQRSAKVMWFVAHPSHKRWQVGAWGGALPPHTPLPGFALTWPGRSLGGGGRAHAWRASPALPLLLVLGCRAAPLFLHPPPAVAPPKRVPVHGPAAADTATDDDSTTSSPSMAAAYPAAAAAVAAAALWEAAA